MTDFDPSFPPALAAASTFDYDYKRTGIDFEPYDCFMSPSEVASWVHAWTCNPDFDGAEFRLFGQDGSGGFAALWLVREGRPLAEQPIVFFGSEGELGVVARNLDDYLWVLAGGFGPYEATADRASEREPIPELTAIASKHAPDARQPAAELMRLAREEFPNFEDLIMGQCRMPGASS